MSTIGVIEGFFGPAWPDNDRKSYAEFLAESKADFYIYAPKQDQNLRKRWRDQWDQDYVDKLQELIIHFHKHNIKFGVGFSPFGLGTSLSTEDKVALEEKLEIFNDLKLDMIGLFFDDMPVTANLASTQLEILKIIKERFHQKIIFCPTFYTFDPILEKVFGKKPDNYLEDIASGVPANVAIAWTGPKVISPSIDFDHLRDVQSLLKRLPYLWENIFANDGPKNCKFLKLRPYTGRSRDVSKETEAVGLNLMNQPQLSKIVFLASVLVLKDKLDPTTAFEAALERLCSESLKSFLLAHAREFCDSGLNNLSEADRQRYLTELNLISDLAAVEIKQWLQGEYNVGSECLTD